MEKVKTVFDKGYFESLSDDEKEKYLEDLIYSALGANQNQTEKE